MDGLKTKEDRRFQTFWVIFFILISVIAIIPVLRVISISFSGRDAINKGQVFIFPIGFNVDAYAKALKSGTFVSSFGYSIILMAVVTAVDMIMTILLAYPLSRKGLKGSKIVNLFCVITMYLNLGTIPNYLNIKSFGMIDTVWALIIPGALSVYNMIIMRTAFASIDDSLYEAARIDGLNEIQIFFQMYMPVMKSTYAAAAVITFMNAWNAYLWPKICMTDGESLNMVMLIANMTGGYKLDYGMIMMGVLFCSIPTMVVFFILQKQFAEGITGAVK